MIKCNPKVWDLEAFIAAGNDYIDDWTVMHNYRSELMTPGDPVVFWVTGPAHSRLEPGVWGVGHVVAPVNVAVEEVEESNEAEDSGDGYWLNLEAEARARFFVIVDVLLIEAPLSRESLRMTHALENCEMLRQPQMGNPNWLDKDEWAALQDLLGDLSLEPVDPADLARWRRDAEVQEPDPNTRRVIEHAAVEFVTDALESDGWRVEDVQKDNLGWDLNARRKGVLRRLEVKGRGPAELIVLLSANEVLAAREAEGWELALLTSALDRPKLTWHTASEVAAKAVPVTYKAILS